MNIIAIMEAKYPEADFGEYFRFLVSCAGTLKGLTHEHHIAPRKQFPELAEEPENFITLTITDHATAHKLLGAAVPEMFMGTGWIEQQKYAASKGGKITGHKQAMQCIGCFSAEGQRKAGHLGGLKGGKTRAATAGALAAAGRIGGKSGAGAKAQIKLRIGWHSPEHQRRVGSIGGKIGAPQTNHKRWHLNRNIISAECELCQK